MSVHGNEFKNNTLASVPDHAPRHVVSAIQTASQKTGVDFSYLIQKASTESSFRTNIQAKTSSATGLYQFIESTWLEMVKKHGAKYGLENQAAQIDVNGRVSDGAARKSILHLRTDPQLSSLMAAEYASENKAFLERTIGGNIGNTELYLAHFMGPSGSAAFLNEHRHNPLQVAADLFPQAARANKGVFYDSTTGQPRTLEQVYAFFDKKFDGPQAPSKPSTHMIARQPQEEPVLEYVTAQPNRAEYARAEKAYRHVPPSLYGEIEVRGNWNKKKVQNTQNSFSTRIIQSALNPDRQGESDSNLRLAAQNLYSKISISPADVAFMRRLNG